MDFVVLVFMDLEFCMLLILGFGLYGFRGLGFFGIGVLHVIDFGDWMVWFCGFWILYIGFGFCML